MEEKRMEHLLNSDLNMIIEKKKNMELSFSKKESKYLFKKLDDSFGNIFKIRVNKIITNIGLCLFINQVETFEMIKKKGFFRCSKYLKGKNIVPTIIEALKNHANEFKITKDNIKYLENVLNFCTLYNVFNGILDEIDETINKYNKRILAVEGNKIKASLVKNLLVYIDFLFLKNYDPLRPEDFSKEELAEAASFLIYRCNEKNRISREEHILIEEEFIKSDEMKRLVILACYFKKLQEAEILIDSYAYNCISDNKRIVVRAPHEDIGKAISIGFLRTELQKQYETNIMLMSEKDISKSFDGLAEYFCRILQDDCYELIGEGRIRRYRLKFPMELFKLLYQVNEWLIEEKCYIEQIAKEYFIDINILKKTDIIDGLSLYEFFKIKRLFSFFEYVFSKYILKKVEGDFDLLFRSLVPIQSREGIIQVLCLLDQITKTKAEAFLDIVSWDSESNIVFDLQYHPFLKVKNGYYTPLSIFKMSDSIRNLYASERKKNNSNLMSDGKDDPLVNILEKTFREQGFETKKNIKYKYKEKDGEIDFLAFKDGDMFVAECKNSILPGSIYELRTTYDYIIKAKSQLDAILEAFKDNNFRYDFYKNNAIPDKKGIFFPCIVMGNRLFCGCNQFQYPVRYIHELSNIVRGGRIKTGEGSLLVWEKEVFSIKDLQNYLDDKTSIARVFYDSSIMKKFIYNIGEYEFIQEVYAVNEDMVNKKIEEKKFAKVE